MGSPTQQTDSVLAVGAADFVLDQLQIQPNPLTQEEAQGIIRGVIKIVSPQINYLGEFQPLQEVLEEHARRRVLVPEVGSASLPLGFAPRTKVLKVLHCWLHTPEKSETQRFLYLADEDLLSLDITVSGADDAVHWQLMPLEVEQVFDQFLNTRTSVRDVGSYRFDVRQITFVICSSLLQTTSATVHRKTSQLESMTELRDQLAGLIERLQRVLGSC